MERFNENEKQEINERINDTVAALGCMVDEGNVFDIREAIRLLCEYKSIVNE